MDFPAAFDCRGCAVGVLERYSAAGHPGSASDGHIVACPISPTGSHCCPPARGYSDAGAHLDSPADSHSGANKDTHAAADGYSGSHLYSLVGWLLGRRCSRLCHSRRPSRLPSQHLIRRSFPLPPPCHIRRPPRLPKGRLHPCLRPRLRRRLIKGLGGMREPLTI